MKLKKELNLIDVFCIASGAMISSGLFILPAIAYSITGPSVFIAYIIAAVLVVPALLSKAELATAMPKAGGDYFFINRSMGAGFGTLAGISAWFSLGLKTAFALIGIGAFSILVFPGISLFQIKLISVIACVFFTITNLISVKHTGKFQVLLVFSLIAIIIFFIARGIPSINLENFRPFMKGNIRSLFATAGLIFVSYGGLTKVVSVAEEVKNPTRNLPLGIILSFIIITLLYALATFVMVGLLGDSVLVNGKPSFTPLSDAASVFAGNFGLILLAVGAILAFLSTGNAGILAASRAPMAMSRDNLIPQSFSRVNSRFKTPHVSIIVTSVFMIIAIIFLDLEMLAKTASTLKILLFASVNIAVIIMRESGLQNYRPKFKSPLYPWIQIAGVIGYAFLIFEMGLIPLLITSVFLLSGLLWYWLYGRIRSNRESAMFQIVRKITAKELKAQPLEDELREIIRERDDILKDRFDRLIENCKIIDIKQTMNYEEFFKLISDEISSDLNISSDSFYSQILERENESTTVLTPFLAIPHIIIPGSNVFTVLIARSKEGISFMEKSSKVHAVFVLTGSRDERHFHLTALAALAQIVQNSDFEKRWLSARNKETLRDIILLGRRNRAI